MATRELISSQLKSFNRTYRLVIYRTSTPASGADFFVSKVATPGGQTTNGIVITDLRVKFNIRRDLSKHPNACDIEISNLAPATRAALEQKPLFVEFYAGYAGVNRLLFTGDVVFAQSEQKDASWLTMLQIADGSRIAQYARVNRSYAKTTTYKAVIKDMLKSMGQEMPANLAASRELDAQFGSSVATLGTAGDELTRILAPFGYEWSFQNNKIQILKDADSRQDILQVNEDMGMIGTPAFGQPKKSGKLPQMTVEMLLYPELLPGGKIEIKSVAIHSGKPTLFSLKSVKHDGDIDGHEWFTKCEIEPL